MNPQNGTLGKPANPNLRSTQWIRVNKPEHATNHRMPAISMTFHQNTTPRSIPILDKKSPKLLNPARCMTENLHMTNKNTHSPDTSHSVVLMKGETQWRFAWKNGEETIAVKAITDIAKSTETDFDWFDAAMVCHEMTKITAKAA